MEILELLGYGVKCISIFFVNGLGDLVEFITYSPLYLVFVGCILYVFKKRSTEVEIRNIRPIRQQVSGVRHRGAQVQKDSTTIEWKEINEDKARVLSLYFWIAISFMIAIFISDADVIVVVCGLYMWILASVMIYKLQGRQDQMQIAEHAENFFLGFCWLSILLRGLYFLVISQSGHKISRALHMSVSAATLPTLAQFLAQMQIWATAGIIIGYTVWMFNTYRQRKNNRDLIQREAELLRHTSMNGADWHDRTF